MLQLSLPGRGKTVPFLWYLFLPFTALATVSLILLLWFISSAWEEFYLKHTLGELEARAQLLVTPYAGYFRSGTPPEASLLELNREIQQEGVDSATRITFILPDGRVIADSEHDFRRMENHADRPEIQQALAGEVGQKIRYSTTHGVTMDYIAIPVMIDGRVAAVIRTSFSHAAIDSEITLIQKRLMILFSLLILIMGFSTLIISRRITSPLTRIKFAAEQFKDGDFTHRITSPRISELAQLARTINTMAETLENSFAIISNQKEDLLRENRARKLNADMLRETNKLLEQDAFIDPVTLIANRRKFDMALSGEWNRMQRTEKPLSLLLCDIDHFKKFNDSYGHQLGDLCLYSVAQAIKKACARPADMVTRYGGEEFAVILPNTDREGAITIAELIRTKIAELQIKHSSSPDSEFLTVSIGVATTLPRPDSDIYGVVKKADMALYAAKNGGRDRLVVAGDEEVNNRSNAEAIR